MPGFVTDLQLQSGLDRCTQGRFRGNGGIYFHAAAFSCDRQIRKNGSVSGGNDSSDSEVQVFSPNYGVNFTVRGKVRRGATLNKGYPLA